MKNADFQPKSPQIFEIVNILFWWNRHNFPILELAGALHGQENLTEVDTIQ